jgi:Pvc16 N-terminal domain
VLAETDQALATLVRTNVLGAAKIAVAFDPPSRPWIQGLKAPTINFFLFDLRENVHRRDEGFTDVRDASGKVVSRQRPMQRWDLHYTVSVFAPDIIVEHRVLAAVLRYFAQIDAIPLDALPPALAEPGYPILVSTGSGVKRSMFLNYAGDMKAGFEMAITVPIPPLPGPPVPPPVLEPPIINVEPMPGAGSSPAVRHHHRRRGRNARNGRNGRNRGDGHAHESHRRR